MSIVTVKNKYQVVIPQSVREQIGVDVGDMLEAKAEKGKITFTPKTVVDRDEYTPAQRRVINREIAKSLEDIKKGRVYGPFNTAHEMVTSMKKDLKKRAAAKKAKPSR